MSIVVRGVEGIDESNRNEVIKDLRRYLDTDTLWYDI